MEAWLETAAGDRIPVQGPLSIGRASQNALSLPGDPRVSRRHALIHPQGAGEFWIVDLGSSNGVFINGRRLRQPVQLHDHDKIEIGSTTFTFLQSEAPLFPGDSPAPRTTNYVTLKDIKTEELWLLVADIVGFTPLSQSVPGDELARLVGRWICACKEAIEQQDGVINKYLGDGFLAYWPQAGVPPEKVRQTLETLRALQQQTREFSFRVVIHRGRITVDNAVSLGENSLIGPDVNYVFRMEKVASQLKELCLLSAPAAALLYPAAECRSVGRHPLHGFEGDFEFFAPPGPPPPA
ncbi:MAG: adenylate/guanylate cyclase domain-containing protein [Verrucomicrobiae bacterium]|nr:adenylate/guanylate cyclase domain-containing protein [Verrucomicrobiae bacterium]